MTRWSWGRDARWRGLLLVASLSAALLVVAAPAGAAPAYQPRPPLRAASFFTWFPSAWHGASPRPASHYTPSAGAYSSIDRRVLARQFAALRYARVDVGLVRIPGLQTPSAARLTRVLAIAARARTRLRFAAVYEPGVGASRGVRQLRRVLRGIVATDARYPSYLRIGRRPVVFVAGKASGSCAIARRWHAANTVGAYVVLQIASGRPRCGRLVASWYRAAPAKAESRVPGYSFTISPGYFAGTESAPRLVRDLARWRRSVRAMVGSHAAWQIVTSFNDWGQGSAVESAREWASASGYGAYLDALATSGAEPPVGVGPVGLPTAAAAGASGISTTSALLTGSIDPAGGATSYRFEYGIDTGYGGATTTATLPAGRAQSVTATVTGLQPGTTYHFRLVATNSAGSVTTPDGSFTTAPASDRDPLIVAAGDIACDPSDANFHGGAGSPIACHELAVSELAIAASPAAVLPLGDNQYDSGAATAFAASYDPSWGRLKAITHPTTGNHEYMTPSAAGYFSYFGSAAGQPGHGFYSYDVGAWHLIALNSNCTPAGGCKPGSPQETWLKSDLAAHRNACTLAYWHHPRFSSGQYGDRLQTQPLLNDLYAAGADVVLNGHDHDYERFGPQTPTGAADPSRGIREFVVGTGGKNHDAIGELQPNSEAHDQYTFGVLELRLHPTSYDWLFVPEPGGTFTDAGSQSCH